MTLPDTAGHFRIKFTLDELAKVPSWGEPGNCRLHWFGLTSGRFWIETASGSPLEYTPEIQKHWSLSGQYPDYHVARFFEDLLSILPAVLESVPTDIAARIANPEWRSQAELWRGDDELRWDRWYSATQWWHERTLDMAYLQHAPQSIFWRIGNIVFLQWSADGKQDAIPVWVLPQGQISIPADLFEAAVFGFCEELLEAMRQRVRLIQKNGWTRTDCTLDVEELAREQQARCVYFQATRDREQTTNWREVRNSFDILLALMGEPMTSCE